MLPWKETLLLLRIGRSSMKQKALLIPFNSKQEIFLQDRRGHKPPPWGFFGGGIEEGETPVQAVIRETKEELDLNLTEDDIVYIGSNIPTIGGVTAKRSLFLYRTNQKVFTVLEGAGGSWMDKKTVVEHLGIDERFEKIWQMIMDNV